MQIIKIQTQDIPALTKIYQQELPQGFLTHFVNTLLQLFFQTTIDSKNAFTLVAKRNDKTLGFATCTLSEPRLIAEMLRRNPFQAFLTTSRTFFKNPSLAKEFFSWVAYFQKEKIRPQLLILAVRSKFQKQGIGQVLLQAVKNEFKNLGAAKFKVGAWEKMEGANCFYQKTGGKFLEVIKLPRKKVIFYSYEIS